MHRPTSTRILMIALLACHLALVPRAGAQELAARETLRVLFIGSSYTYYNNLGDIVAAIAAADAVGPIIEPTLAPYAGASSLKTHLENGSTRKLVERGGWDWVVLQETSLLPGGSEAGPDGRPVAGDPAEFHASVRTWTDIVRKAGAKPALLMTWPRRLPRPDSGVQPMAKAVADAYLGIGRELSVPVAPVGLAWEETRRRIPALDLHIWDGSHPNQTGSYLAGLVVYATLTGRSPVGAPSVIYGRPFTTVPAATFGGTIDWRVVDPDLRINLVDLGEATAGELQRIAARIVSGS
jgi:lysophospholipase L1-like esterase